MIETMVNDDINIKLEGHLVIKTGDQVLFEKQNEILPSAKNIMVSCLSNLKGNNQLDTITAIGDFGEVDFNVINIEQRTKQSITFISELGDSKVNGNILFLVLKSSNLGAFSRKELTNIYKDNNIMLTIEWTIRVN